MRTYKSFATLVFSILFLISIALVAVRTQDRKDENLGPVAEFDPTPSTTSGASTAAAATHQARGRKYNKTRNIKVDPSPEVLEVSGVFHWDPTLSALPFEASDMVVLGRVKDAKAYLSEDKSGIYSEFKLVVSKVYKDAVSKISENQTITIERPGGRLRLPSGQVQKYYLSGGIIARIFDHISGLKVDHRLIYNPFSFQRQRAAC